MWGGTVLWMIATPRTMQRMPVWYLDAPVGRTAFGNPVRYEKYQWLMERTRPGDFFYGSFYPDSYYSLDLRNPADTPFITPNDYTRPEQVENVVQALERHQVRFVLWVWSLDAPRPNPWSHDNLPPLRAYLRSHYHVASTFSDGDQILERNP
jgi:hypothetical protein